MNRRARRVWLLGGLAVMAASMLAVGLPRGFDHRHCEFGILSISCSWTTHQRTTGIPAAGWKSPLEAISGPISITKSSSRRTSGSGYDDVTLWAVTSLCPQDYIAKRLPCVAASVAAPARDASDELQMQLSDATGLPLPERWILATVKNSPFIKSVHVEMPVDLAAALGFYRVELSKRGWTENDGAVVAPDRAEIAFTTPEGPALLRLIHQDDRTIADLSLRKPGAANAGILPTPGQVRLMLGNDTDEEAVITINEQSIRLAARAGEELANSAEAGRKLPDSQKIDLLPGKYKVTLEMASGAAQNREFEVAAGETWGLLVGPAGAPLPVRLY
jgi:hypothetical protein